MNVALAIKGRGDMLVITVPDGAWEEARQILLTGVEERSDFLRGARLALDLGDREVGAAALADLRQALSDRDLVLGAILSPIESTRTAAADLGLAVELPHPTAPEEVRDIALSSEVMGEEAVLVRRTVRSGHTIRHPGHVVVIGDVNPGAEIIAGGDVVVWGRLRGVVHAGAAGNEDAIVCALDLAPTQLRIAGHISVSPARKGTAKPEAVRLHQGQLVAEGWRAEHRS